MMEAFIIFFTDHFIIISIWFFLLIAVIYVTFLCWCNNFSEISCYQAVRLINKEESIVVDVRNQCDFYQGYIINSLNASASDIRSSSARELLRFKIKPLIIVCNDGVVSCSIARYLYQLGFRKIYVLKGGIIGWESNDLPLVQKNK